MYEECKNADGDKKLTLVGDRLISAGVICRGEPYKSDHETGRRKDNRQKRRPEEERSENSSLCGSRRFNSIVHRIIHFTIISPEDKNVSL